MISLSRPKSSGDSLSPGTPGVLSLGKYLSTRCLGGGALDSSRCGAGLGKGASLKVTEAQQEQEEWGSSTSCLPCSTGGPPAALGPLRGCALCPLKTCHPSCKEGQPASQRRPSTLGEAQGPGTPEPFCSALGHPLSHTSPQNIHVLVLRGGHGAVSSQFPSGLMFFGGLLLGESVSDVGATPEPTPSASSLTSYTGSFTPLTRRNSKSPPISCSMVTPKAFLRTLRAWAVEKADDSDLSSANWITVGKSLIIKSQFSISKMVKIGPTFGGCY